VGSAPPESRNITDPMLDPNALQKNGGPDYRVNAKGPNDLDSAFRYQRQGALRGIALSGWHWRLELANKARRRNRNVPATDEDLRD
jgi:hypothetical protein